MTRQKKEIVKRIDWLYRCIEADVELGCGIYVEDAYKETYDKINQLQEELAHLQHYQSVDDMMYDPRQDPRNW